MNPSTGRTDTYIRPQMRRVGAQLTERHIDIVDEAALQRQQRLHRSELIDVADDIEIVVVLIEEVLMLAAGVRGGRQRIAEEQQRPEHEREIDLTRGALNRVCVSHYHRNVPPR